MKINNINIHQFLDKFNKEYSFLYENKNRVAGYKEAVQAFDAMLTSKHKPFIIEFVNFRQDFISSDREAAAFMFTLYDMISD